MTIDLVEKQTSIGYSRKKMASVFPYCLRRDGVENASTGKADVAGDVIKVS